MIQVSTRQRLLAASHLRASGVGNPEAVISVVDGAACLVEEGMPSAARVLLAAVVTPQVASEAVHILRGCAACTRLVTLPTKHIATRTQWPLVAVLWGWRCTCGEREDPRHFSPELADAAAAAHVAGAGQ